MSHQCLSKSVSYIRFQNESNITQFYHLLQFDEDETFPDRVSCALEFWNENQMTYEKYVDFYLSETDSYRLDLPEKTPLQVVACIWRIVLTSSTSFSKSSQDFQKSLISTRALVACLKIDSYFNPTIIPNIQASLNIGSILVSIYNNIEPNYYEKLPAPLDIYQMNGTIPDSQCFALVEHKNTNCVFNKWQNDALSLKVSGDLCVSVIDYGTLMLEPVLNVYKEKTQLLISSIADLSVNCDFLRFNVNPAICHTLSTSTHMWLNTFKEEKVDNIMLLSRYIVANNTNVPLRFGQSGTEDNIILESRKCHFYSWRQVNNQVIFEHLWFAGI